MPARKNQPRGRPDTGEEEDWMTAKDAAAYAGIKVATFRQARQKGLAPPPDLVWLGRHLWKPETIRLWRSEKRKRKKNRSHIKGVPRTRAKGTAPPKIVRNAGTTSGASKTRRRLANRKVVVPENSVITEAKARKIAAELRGLGFHCTSADVLALHLVDEPLDDVVREQLRRKVRARA